MITPGPEVTAKVTGFFEAPPLAARFTESVVSLSGIAAKVIVWELRLSKVKIEDVVEVPNCDDPNRTTRKPIP